MSESNNPVMDRLKSWPINILPHHAISRITYALTRIQSPLARPVIRWFIKTFNVNMQDAAIQDISQYRSFNDFFTRELKSGIRPLFQGDSVIVSPVDGTVSQSGKIDEDAIFQAKGHEYSLQTLIGGGAETASCFRNGRFATIYLSPRDYHRIHMPVDGQLSSQVHIPGRLFSVAPHTVNTVPGLFARNERVVAFFDTPSGPLAMVLVGAINVAAIETVWSGLVTPPAGKSISTVTYSGEQAIRLSKGQEMGRFNMGSTVILLFNDSIEWDAMLMPGSMVKMGEKIGTVASCLEEHDKN